MYELPASKFDGVLSVCTDVQHLNRIANHPGVRPHVGGEGVLDFSQAVERDLVLATEGGFYLFSQKTESSYEFHSTFLPEYRGKHAYRAAKAACEFMFLTTPAIELHTRSPFENPMSTPPKTFGFQHWFDEKDCSVHRLHIIDWAKRAPTLEAWGDWFHHSLEDARKGFGIDDPIHDEDKNNNRYAGLAVGMVRGDQPLKAVRSYNQWAATAGYIPAQLIQSDPAVIYTGDAVVKYENNRMEFIQCL